MARRVRVASRAIRRGRKLRTRISDLPPPPAPNAAAEDDEDEAGHYARPPAPSFLSEQVDDLARANLDSARSDSHSGPSTHVEPEPPNAPADDDEPAIERRSKFSRPPAPRVDFSAGSVSAGPAVAEPSSHDGLSDDEISERVLNAPVDLGDSADPNATTLMSAQAAGRPSSAPSRVVVEEAPDADDGAREAGDGDMPGFVPEDDEPPASFPPDLLDREDAAPVSSSLDKPFFREHDSTMAPVVDDLEDERVIEMLTAEQAARRRSLRRGVGIGVAFAGLLLIGFVAKATIVGGDPAEASASDTAEDAPQAALAPADDAPPPPTDTDEAPTDEAAADPDGEAEAPPIEPPSGDYEEVTKTTLDLLNERKFEEALAHAQKLIDLEPKNAFGYRCLGAALQDLGRMTEARKAYSQCVTYATAGEVAECTALGGARLDR